MLERIQPTQLVLVEAEVWPNLTAAAERLGIPVSSRQCASLSTFAVNAATASSAGFVEPHLRHAETGSRAGRRRHRPLGELSASSATASTSPAASNTIPKVPASQLAKIDELRNVLTQTGISASQPILLAASTHAGEEIELARVFQRLRVKKSATSRCSSCPVTSSAAPRSPLRSTPSASPLPCAAIPLARVDSNSRPSSSSTPPANSPRGSTSPRSSSSAKVSSPKAVKTPPKPRLRKKPVLFGPHMENFTPLVELLLKKKGAQQVENFDELTTACLALLQDAAKAAQMGQSGQRALQAHQGATQKSVERLLSSPP
jgi:3-deoxy-D-manno-octulosonic-acid transferase